MSIQAFERGASNVFGFQVKGKLTPDEVQAFLPTMEETLRLSKKKVRFLIDVTGMEGANIKPEWEIFEFLKKHLERVEYIAIVGAHAWTKVMDEVLAGSVFAQIETRYFESKEIEDAWYWLFNAAHPSNVPVRRVINSDKGLFTKYSSPDYI